MEPPSYADVLAAAPVVHRHVRPTPLYEWPALSSLLGCRFFLKHENHTPVGAFKVRGGIYLVSRLSDEMRQRGIIGCTTGNHGQSLAYAARVFGVRCVIVVPRDSNPGKLASMRSLGAELVEHGRDFDEARDHCEALNRRENLRYVHSANEPDLIAGVGSYALELFDDLPNPDVILVPVGLGSGICGTSIVAAERSPGTKVIGVQAEGAPAMTLSWRAGKLIETESVNTFADGVATRRPAELTQAIMRRSSTTWCWSATRRCGRRSAYSWSTRTTSRREPGPRRWRRRCRCGGSWRARRSSACCREATSTCVSWPAWSRRPRQPSGTYRPTSRMASADRPR